MPATLLPPTADLLARAATGILAQHRAQMPDLSRIVVLVPSAAMLRGLRRELARAAAGALLGPQLLTLSAFAAQHGSSTRALTALDCRLLLARELESHTHLFGGQDALALADELFSLFEQLSAQTPELAQDERRFTERIEQAYGAQLGGISREAHMVHTLWRAYLQQTAEGSPAIAGARALQAAFAALSGDAHAHLVGFDSFSPSEAAVVRSALAAGRVNLWLHGRLSGRDGATLTALCTQLRIDPEPATDRDDARSAWLDALFGGGAPLRQRMPDTDAGLLPRLQAAAGPEHETRIADLALRQWLLAGRRDLVVVAQDRRYARRLRALLERARVPLRDEVGWALSTSTAAASLMHWVDVCENNFPYRAALDLLKSAFFDPGRTQRKAVEALEGQIRQRRVLSGLARLMAIDDSARALLQPLEAPSQQLNPGAGARPAHYWCENLLDSLRALPLWTHWQADAAGRALTTALEELHAALKRNGLRLSWRDFRRLLERTLERATFDNDPSGAGVRLLTLEQTQGLRCDALILAGAAAGKFPGSGNAQPLFNHTVRAELGLPHWNAQQQLALTRFRLLMQAAPEVLITWAPEDESEPAQPCAWAEALLAARTPQATELAALARRAEVEVTAEPDALPLRMSRPRPPAQPALLPPQLSAGAHQRLIDCPYQFHAADSLRLRAPQAADEPYSQRDFGERVHEILARFLGPVMPGDEAQAAQQLEQLARTAFAPDLRARALAQAWLQRFITLIPSLVTWFAERGALWTRAQAELELERELAPGLHLYGRIDRLESAADGTQCIVDYKTGAAPTLADIASGEAVQATHYALLTEACAQVEYLLLQDTSKPSRMLAGAALDEAREGVSTRLIEIQHALHAGAALPAHGDEASCRWCDHAGLCRKGAWIDD